MQVFKALSDDTRYQILKVMLEKGRVCICKIGDSFEKDNSVVYRHIMKLESAGLVETEKEGRKLMCNVSHPQEVRDLIESAEIVKNSNTRGENIEF